METNRLSLVRRRANKLFEKYSLTVPVNLGKIIEQKHIEVVYEENNFGIDGLCRLQKNPPVIILNTGMTWEPRRRFTIAHEIGHICIPWHTGIDLCSLDDPYIRIEGQQMVNTQELEANTFASELLMPTEWIKDTFNLNTSDLSALTTRISNAANTSIMACFYALENVLPAGEFFLVKTDIGEFWKPFKSVNTNVSISNAVDFYDEVCSWKNEFKISRYNVIHYRMLPEPDFSILNNIYLACGSNFQDMMFAITGGNPILAAPYMKKIVQTLSDPFYIILKVGDSVFRHFRSDNSAIRMHNQNYDDDIDDLYQYIEKYFCDYGRIDLSPKSCLLWVKEHWYSSTVKASEGDPNQLLKTIVNDLYSPEDFLHMLQSINGVMASINSLHPNAAKKQLYHYAKMRFETDPKYEAFVYHYHFEQYLLGKIESLIAKRI